MERVRKIALSKIFDKQVSSRSAVDSVFSGISGVHHIVLDFSSIEFISRSAAHQLICAVDQLQNSRITVEMISLFPDVIQMINKVRQSIKSPKKLATHVEFVSFSSEKEMEDFVLSF
ncbi:hypothetical protein P872_14540 [Rhodonellum psychrophilum GCM71 = DSM 17998]|uniref:STAS domain-containing protein n=2 Tax=Rhodonellum TaxID=336827 RepID=U5BQF5_9BACT|nr:MULTISPECIES: STAS domain-containing protein [Rhodonellum]ERM80133.1 hypothetical protein P872_14540 [Rhodonellum psychrophilum GCM71 = DSM 17998]MDO9553117.1 STAS domain-containing protein [Rhodonellum sp.]SDZ55191.1 STAS domain-containing protein [Rhodonellum ikkaensis]